MICKAAWPRRRARARRASPTLSPVAGAPAAPRNGVALDAISVKRDGKAASATTIARKRSVFANVIRYAVELEEILTNPLGRLSWTPPKVSEVVDRRVVVNPPYGVYCR